MVALSLSILQPLLVMLASNPDSWSFSHPFSGLAEDWLWAHPHCPDFSQCLHFLMQRMCLGRRKRRPVSLRQYQLQPPLPLSFPLLRPHTDSRSGIIGGASPRKSSLAVAPPSYLHCPHGGRWHSGKEADLKTVLFLAAS